MSETTSEDISEDQDKPLPEEVAIAIGSRLRSAREAASMSTEAVASNLKLYEEVVQHLELGTYESLPEPAYVRGYLRAYLRLLNLPSSLLKSFDESFALNQPLVTSTALEGVSCSRDGWVRCVSTGLVVLLLAALILWVLEQSFSILDSAESLITQTNQPHRVKQTQVVSAPASEAQSEAVKVAAPLSETQATKVTEVAAPETVDSAKPAVIAKEPQLITETEVPKTIQSVPQVSKSPVPVLTMKFSDATWIRVDDNEGNRLKTGTFNQGEKINIEHKGSLHLVIGRAKNVEVAYAGKSVDLSAYDNGRVARLVLGEQTHQ